MMQPHRRLEVEWAAFNRLDPAGMVACSSGTAAIHLAFEAFRLPPGSEIICPTFTMVACGRAIKAAGLEPVLVDCGDDLNMDPGLVGPIAWSSCSGMLAVHVYGRRCNMARLSEISWDTGTPLVEDLAEAHGVQPHPDTDAACWSFFRNKIVAGEEGGAVWFRDPALAERARALRSLGLAPRDDPAVPPSPWLHLPRGWNHRMSDAHAVLVMDSLDLYQKNLERRWELWEGYDRLCPAAWRMPRSDAPWVYPLRVPGLGLDRMTRTIGELCSRGVQARHGFRPLHLLEEFRGCRRVGGERAEAAHEEVFYLPLDPALPPDAPRTAFQVLGEALGGVGIHLESFLRGFRGKGRSPGPGETIGA